MKSLMISLTLVAGCSTTPEVITITPPVAFLQLPPSPAIPENATNVTLATYLYQLYDSNKLCRQQLAEIKKWSEKQKTERKK